MASKTVIKSRLEFRRKALEQAQTAYLALLSGQVKSYAVGTRNLTRLDLPQLEDTISKLEKEIDGLEAVLCGGKRRKAVGAIGLQHIHRPGARGGGLLLPSAPARR